MRATTKPVKAKPLARKKSLACNPVPAAIVRTRAVDAAEKLARRETLLDAADRLFTKTQTLANVAEVAKEAGLAKGTVYLYFETKEAIYLALHMRKVEEFFTALIARLQNKTKFSFIQMFQIANQYMIADKNYMPLCACCMGFGENLVNPATGAHFQEQLSVWLSRSGRGLESHFKKLKVGDGVRLLNHSYGLMIGMFHLLGERSPQNTPPQRPTLREMGSYQAESIAALSAYWEVALKGGLHSAVEPDQINKKQFTKA
jgi:AcrR family transcriptional regulator